MNQDQPAGYFIKLIAAEHQILADAARMLNALLAHGWLEDSEYPDIEQCLVDMKRISTLLDKVQRKDSKVYEIEDMQATMIEIARDLRTLKSDMIKLMDEIASHTSASTDEEIQTRRNAFNERREIFDSFADELDAQRSKYRSEGKATELEPITRWLQNFSDADLLNGTALADIDGFNNSVQQTDENPQDIKKIVALMFVCEASRCLDEVTNWNLDFSSRCSTKNPPRSSRGE